eukprot:9883057-Prorocentrum_lima.AAC.1
MLLWAKESWKEHVPHMFSSVMVSPYAYIAKIRDNIKVIVSTTDAWCKARSRSGSTMANRIAVHKEL